MDQLSGFRNSLLARKNPGREAEAVVSGGGYLIRWLPF
jgi:hypothetical protein